MPRVYEEEKHQEHRRLTSTLELISLGTEHVHILGDELELLSDDLERFGETSGRMTWGRAGGRGPLRLETPVLEMKMEG